MLMKTFLLAVIFFILGSIANAEDFALNGFLQFNYSSNLEEQNPDKGDLKWSEERVQLKLSADREPFYLFIKGDAFYDNIDEKSDLELREAYIDYLSEKWDIRIGRQIITWGIGDLIFINDIFPKDYEAFFSGRPLEYLKKGVDGIRIGMYPSFASAELVIIPVFEPDTYPLYPHNNRLWVYDPKFRILHPRKEIMPDEKIENTEIALRIYRNISEFDVSIYFYRGFYRKPHWFPDRIPGPSEMDYYHPKLSAYGASLQGRLLNGVVSIESGFYDSRQDRDGTEPVIPNQTTRFLAGYQKQIWKDFTAGLQYYTSHMHDYSEYKINHMLRAPSCPLEKKIQNLFTLRLTQFFLHQTLRLSMFAFWSTTYNDYMIIPEVKYSFSDHIWAAVGANIFGGDKAWTQFGQMDKNDNVYLQARYEF